MSLPVEPPLATVSASSTYQETALNREALITASNKMTHLDPWLGLRSRLFLSLFPYGLVALLFVGTRLMISASQVDTDIQHSNATIWSACRETEQAVSTLVSFPHLLADNFNGATKRSVDDAVGGLGVVLLLSITAIESLLVFLVDMYKSMLLCFLQFVVQASIALLISAVQLFSTAVHDIAQSIQVVVRSSVDAINAALSTTLTGFNDVLSIIGKSITVPKVPYPDLSALSNVTIPSTLQDSLVQLNNSLPTLADLKKKIDQLIQTPFEDLKAQVNNTITNYSFNQSALPVPPMQSITYCNETLDTQPLQDLKNELQRAAHIGVGLLVLLAVLFLFFNMMREWYSWHCLKKQVTRTNEAFITSHGDEKNDNVLDHRSLMSLLQLSTHPLLAQSGLKMAMKMGVRSTEGKDRVRWWLAWISHPVGIVLLITGLVGLSSVEVQMAAIDKIGHHYQYRFQNMTDQSAMEIQGRIDAALQGISTDYASKSNAVLQLSQDDLNTHLFEWVNITTSTMNTTLNEFMDGIATAINETFSNTPLFTPVQTLVNCVLGQKVKGIEDGLTWVQSNAHVNFPIVPENILMVNPDATQEVMQPLTNSTLGTNGILADVIGSYEHALKKERVMFVILLLLYLLLFVVGTMIAIPRDTSIFTRLLNHRKGDENKLGGSQDSLLSPPFRGYMTTTYDGSAFPGVALSHHSISNPLHPDVASLYLHQTSPLSINRPLVVANPNSKRCSWESLLDTRDSTMQQNQGPICETNDTKQKWLQKLPSYRSNSTDSSYQPTARNFHQSDIVDAEVEDDDKVLSFWLWKRKEDTLRQDDDSYKRQSLPIISSPMTSFKEPPTYPTSCDSGHHSKYSYSDEQSRNSSLALKGQSSNHTQTLEPVRRNLPLSYISEKPESDKESLASNGRRLSKTASPKLFFRDPDQVDDVPLQRYRHETLLLKLGQAL